MHYARPFVLRCTVLAILIGGFLGVDFAVPLVDPGSGPNVLGTVLLGCCIGQINLIGVWAALAPGNFVVRLPWSALLGAMMWYALILGNRVSDETRFALSRAMLLGVFLLAGIVVAQIPLWIARLDFRWRLTHRDASPDPSGRGRLQFNLQQMLLGTTLLSIALAPVRTVLPLNVGNSTYYRGELSELLVLFAAATVCNLVATMPCIWGAMRAVSKLILLGIGWLLYCGVLTAAEYGTLVAFWGSPPGVEARTAIFFYLLNVSQCATVFGSLLLLRALGFQLVRTSPPGQPGSPTAISVVSPPTEAESTLVNQATQESP